MLMLVAGQKLVQTSGPRDYVNAMMDHVLL